MENKSKQKTFQNLQVLEETRAAVREALGGKYFDIVEPFVNIIQKVAAANNENHFEAVKRIQNNTDMMGDLQRKSIFASALMEIVEEKDFKILSDE